MPVRAAHTVQTSHKFALTFTSGDKNRLCKSTFYFVPSQSVQVIREAIIFQLLATAERTVSA
jgi:hypothetical protein